MSQRTSYVAHINRVIDFIDAHLAESLDLHALASLAHFSPWHFHRLFQAFTDETLANRVRRRRLEVAAARLLASPPSTAISIALDVGFGSAEVFARAFKAHFGVTPTAWRRGAYRDWSTQHRTELSKIHQAHRNARQAIDEAFRDDAHAGPTGRALHSKGIEMNAKTRVRMNVEMVTLPETRVAYMRHVGPYGDPGISRMWQRFEAWCRQRGLLGQHRAIYGISRDSPDITAPGKCRYDAGIAVDEGFEAEGNVGVQTISAGLYACAQFSGTPDKIHAAWVALCVDWLPDSAYQADDRPALEAYGDEPVVDKQTGAFSCRLCLPVRAL